MGEVECGYPHLVHRVCLLQSLYRIDAEMNRYSALMFGLSMDREVVENWPLFSPHLTSHSMIRKDSGNHAARTLLVQRRKKQQQPGNGRSTHNQSSTTRA